MYKLSEAAWNGNPFAAAFLILILLVILLGMHGSSKNTQRLLDELREPDE